MMPKEHEQVFDPELELPALDNYTQIFGDHELKTVPLVIKDVTSLCDTFVQRGLLGKVLSVHSNGIPSKTRDPRIYMNLDAPSSGLVCGVQGSGKSHTVSCILESSLMVDRSIGTLPSPLATIVFHFDEENGGRPCEAAFLILDEAHKYLTKSDANRFTKTICSIIRQQRHLAARVIVSTQEPTVVPASVLDLLSWVVCHRFSSPSWVKHLMHHLCVEEIERESGGMEAGNGPSGWGQRVMTLRTGKALLYSPASLKIVLLREVQDTRDNRGNIQGQSPIALPNTTQSSSVSMSKAPLDPLRSEASNIDINSTQPSKNVYGPMLDIIHKFENIRTQRDIPIPAIERDPAMPAALSACGFPNFSSFLTQAEADGVAICHKGQNTKNYIRVELTPLFTSLPTQSSTRIPLLPLQPVATPPSSKPAALNVIPTQYETLISTIKRLASDGQWVRQSNIGIEIAKHDPGYYQRAGFKCLKDLVLAAQKQGLVEARGTSGFEELRLRV